MTFHFYLFNEPLHYIISFETVIYLQVKVQAHYALSIPNLLVYKNILCHNPLPSKRYSIFNKPSHRPKVFATPSTLTPSHRYEQFKLACRASLRGSEI